MGFAAVHEINHEELNITKELSREIPNNLRNFKKN